MRKKMDSQPESLSVWSLPVLPVSVWVFSGNSLRMCKCGELLCINCPSQIECGHVWPCDGRVSCAR